MNADFFITEPNRKPVQKVYIILLFISMFSVLGMLKVLAAYTLFLEVPGGTSGKEPTCLDGRFKETWDQSLG